MTRKIKPDPLAFIKGTNDDAGEIKDKTSESNAQSEEVDKRNKINIFIEESSVGIGTITFEGDMSIYNSKKIQTALCSGVDDYKQFNIELSKVKKIDSSGFQLLLSTLKEIRHKNKVMGFLKPSKEIKKIFNLFGEEQLLKEMIK